MNSSIVRYILGHVLKIEAALMVIPVIVGVIYREKAISAFLITMALCAVCGILMTIKKPANTVFYLKEGCVTTALSWILMSIFGCLPFFISREIPSFTDALFETISGFTTTGASILSEVEGLSQSIMFWRCFTHWIGGMGVLVFLLAVIPLTGGSNINLMKAESPGPSVGKLVPKIRYTARILYIIYFGARRHGGMHQCRLPAHISRMAGRGCPACLCGPAMGPRIALCKDSTKGPNRKINRRKRLRRPLGPVSPPYGLHAVGLEVVVGARKMVVAKPSPAVGRERRGVHRLQHEVARLVDERGLRARVASPQDEHQVVAVGVERLDGGVGKLLPALALVAGGLVRAHRQRGVEQQHALPRPPREVARRRHRRAQVELYLLEYVDERRREGHAVVHREAQPVGLAGLMVWVLADDDHLHAVEGAQVEGVEYELPGRVARVVHVL